MCRIAQGLAATLAVLLTTAAIAVGPGATADLEERARWLEGRIMAPCCRANPVSDHFSPAADEVRREVRALLREGRDERAILDLYVERHGEQILAMPRAAGIGRLAYLAPLIVLAGGIAVVTLALRRWRRGEGTNGGDDDDGAVAPSVSDADAERIAAELRRHG